MAVPLIHIAQVRISLDRDAPLNLGHYRYISSQPVDSVSLELRLQSESGAVYTYSTGTFGVSQGIHSVNASHWASADSTLDSAHRTIHRVLDASYPEHSYEATLRMTDASGKVLADQEFSFHPSETLFATDFRDSLLLLRNLPDRENLEMKGYQRWHWKLLSPVGDTAVDLTGLDSIAFFLEGLLLRKQELPPDRQASSRLSLPSIPANDAFRMLPFPAFSVEGVSLSMTAAYAQRQFAGSALATPYYSSALRAQGNVFGLPLNAVAYGVWLRHSEPSTWPKSPLNYVLVEFDKKRFDQQYAIDLSDDKVRRVIEKRKRQNITARLAIDQQLRGLPGGDLPGVDSLAGVPDTGAVLPSSPVDTAALSKRRKELLKRKAKLAQKEREYERLLHQVDSLQSRGEPLKVSDISPSLRKEFARSGLIQKRFERLETLELGDVYPKRYVSEPGRGANEFRGLSTEINLLRQLSFYGLVGKSRFSLVGGDYQTRLFEAGLIRKFPTGRLSVIASQETVSNAMTSETPGGITPEPSPLRSVGNTYLVLGYEQGLSKRLTVGATAEQQAAALSQLDSLDFNGRYYGYAEADASITRLRVFGEYVDHTFARNVYLNTVNGSIKSGIETHTLFFKGVLQAMVGYEVLFQPGTPDEVNASEVTSSSYKLSLSTHFSKYPNITIAYYPYQTSGKSQLAGGGTLLGFSSRSSLSQASLSYAATGGKLKFQGLLQGQRITNALAYDLQQNHTEVNARVDIATGVFNAYNDHHVFTLNLSAQQMDTAAYHSAFTQYEYNLNTSLSLGVKAGTGRSGQRTTHQLAAILKAHAWGFQLHAEPGLQKFDDSGKLYPLARITLQKDLWKR